MLKNAAFKCTILLALAALVAACSNPTPTPTATPVPPAPTATPTPAPTPTAVPAPTATRPASGSGALAPIGTNDPQAFMSELSAAEQSCLAENVDPQQVMALLGGGLVSPEETTALIQCLEDETLLRLFLTVLIGQTGPLSAESSVCVRSGFANFDLRSVMLATPVESDAAAAMAGSMAGFLLTLSCLNDEEWQAVGPSLGMGADDRDGLQCMVTELGGPEGLAAAQHGVDPTTAFFEASEACKSTGSTPTPTATPTPMPVTPTPTLTPTLMPAPDLATVVEGVRSSVVKVSTALRHRLRRHRGSGEQRKAPWSSPTTTSSRAVGPSTS